MRCGLEVNGCNLLLAFASIATVKQAESGTEEEREKKCANIFVTLSSHTMSGLANKGPRRRNERLE